MKLYIYNFLGLDVLIAGTLPQMPHYKLGAFVLNTKS